MLKNASGVPGLEVLYPLLLKGLTERDLPLTHAARLLAHNPPSCFASRIGRARSPSAARPTSRLRDVDPYRYLRRRQWHNYVAWSPYDGIELPFRVVATFQRGRCIAADGKVSGAPGQGQFVRPPLRRH